MQPILESSIASPAGAPASVWNKYFDKANWHPLANLFPEMTEEEIAELASDIKKNGLTDPIVLHEDKVLDGRNRLLAMELAGISLYKDDFIEWVDMFGDEPTNDTLLTWVVSKNLHRRHLTTSQRATVAVEMETLFAEEAKKRQATSTGGKVPQLKANLPDAATGQARDKAAAAMQVSPRSVQDAKKLKKEDLKAFEQVKAGKQTLNAVKPKKQKPEAPQSSAKSTASTAAIVAGVVNELTETFYVIRRKSDGAYLHRKPEDFRGGVFLVALCGCATFDNTDFPSVAFDCDDDNWEFIKVTATYQLTAVPTEAKKNKCFKGVKAGDTIRTLNGDIISVKLVDRQYIYTENKTFHRGNGREAGGKGHNDAIETAVPQDSKKEEAA